jgi:hypothetical protein
VSKKHTGTFVSFFLFHAMPGTRLSEQVSSFSNGGVPMRARLLCAATAIAICAALASTRAKATILFTAGNNPQTDFVTGTLNDPANSIVDLPSAQSLSEPASGQARVTATTGDFTNLKIFLPGSNSGFASFMRNTNADGTGAATISATNQFGVTTTFPSSSFGNGQSFFTLTMADNELITSVALLSISGP